MVSLQPIFDDCGLDVVRYERVHGGDINDAYCLITSSEKYFLKVNNKDKYPLMFEKEANGLALLRNNSTFVVPEIIKTGGYGDQQYLLLAWLEKGSPKNDMWEKFGEALANMHKRSQPYFGGGEDNYIGSLHQVNTAFNDWPAFYAECRIMPLIKTLFDAGSYSKNDLNDANQLCNGLKNIFPAEPPALLHGDLWAGNYLIHSSGNAAIFDPAVYFGHREMDIGMTKLFGGFDNRLYAAYNESYPLAKSWEKRLALTQLYPLLVHAILFGGHYVARTREILRSFA